MLGILRLSDQALLSDSMEREAEIPTPAAELPRILGLWLRAPIGVLIP